MKFSGSILFWTFIWCLFMGVTAISIGFGALFPSMNRISRPFVCPRGEMSYDQQVYHPYPGNTITTLTWYCTDSLTGEKAEISLFPMSISAGLIYGFVLFLIVVIGMWLLANRSTSTSSTAGYGTQSLSAWEKQPQQSIRDAPYSSDKKFDKPHGRANGSKDAMARMQELKELRAANMISESEYEQKRAEILKNL